MEEWQIFAGPRILDYHTFRLLIIMAQFGKQTDSWMLLDLRGI